MTELSGNVIDVCPVGALTNKVFRFKARAWELTARESIGYHDALGSNLYLHVRRGEVLRTVPRDNEAVNECWLSDRDRYSHQGLYADDRAMQPDAARRRQLARSRLGRSAGRDAAELIRRDRRGATWACWPIRRRRTKRASCWRRLAEALGTRQCRSSHQAASISPMPPWPKPFAMPRRRYRKGRPSCCWSAATSAMNCRCCTSACYKASKRGAKVFAINPVDFDFAFKLAGKRIVAPSKLRGALAAIAQAAGASLPSLLDVDGDESSQSVAEAIKAAGANAVIVLGEMAEGHVAASHLHAAARALATATGARLNRIPQGANAVGLAALGLLPKRAGQARGRHAGRSAAHLPAVRHRAAIRFRRGRPGDQVACRRQGRGIRRVSHPTS